MSNEIRETALITRQKYDRNSKLYNLMEFPLELFWYRRWRRRLFRKVRGVRVLEVGIGTGKNLKYYQQEFWAIGVDISEGMMSKAKPLAKAKGVSLTQMNAENLAFLDNAFDTVLATFVFCSVPDPVKGLQEIRRVLQPEGQALLIEHVQPKNPLLAWIFSTLDPLTSALTGVHINRKTSDNIRKAGFELIREENLLFTIFKFLLARPLRKKEKTHWIKCREGKRRNI